MPHHNSAFTRSDRRCNTRHDLNDSRTTPTRADSCIARVNVEITPCKRPLRRLLIQKSLIGIREHYAPAKKSVGFTLSMTWQADI
jgi:hypothetical protein